MQTPRTFLAYSPRGVGLRCAVAYIASARDACGWFIGPRADLAIAAGYFVLQDLYTDRPVGYEAVDAAALHSDWLLEEPRRHELARLQEVFASEWLVFPDDPRADSERKAYEDAELALGPVPVRFERLARFSTLQPTWTCYSPGFERTVLRHLAKRWPLEYRLPATEKHPRPKRALA